MLEPKDFGCVLNHSDGSDLLEQLKKWLQTKDYDAYQKWKKEGFDINHRFIFYPLDRYNINELTLLHIATEYSNEKVVEALLKAGSDVNSQDTNENTPLYNANIFNKTAVVQVLLEAGADPTLGDKNGKTTNYIVQQVEDNSAQKISSTYIKDENKTCSPTSKAIVAGAIGGVIAGLAIGLGLYFGTSAALTVLPTIIGIALVAALLVGATICAITYDVLKPKSCVDTVYVCKGFDTIKQEANTAASMVV